MVSACRQQGAVLIAMIVTLAILAAIVQMVSAQQGSRTAQLQAEQENQSAQYLAEAGLRHAVWAARTSTNGTYPSVINGSLPGQGSYQAAINPSSGSPISVSSTGISSDGVRFTMKKTYNVCSESAMQKAEITTYVSKGTPTSILETGGNTSVEYLAINHSPHNQNSARGVIKFDLSSLPKGQPFISAELILNVEQHDPAMEGGSLFVNPLTKAFDSTRVDWTVATSQKDPWNVPGGDYTVVNESAKTIRGGMTDYAWNITPMVDGWVNGTLTHDGLVVRTDVTSSLTNHALRFKTNSTKWPQAEWPRLIVKWCN